MKLESSAVRLWKRLDGEERLAAAAAFWRQPSEEVVGTALSAIAKARRMRPQAVRSLDEAARARALAGILDPGEPLAASLLVSLHLGERRHLLRAFLDGAGLQHADGILPEEENDAPVPVSAEQARAGVAALADVPRREVSLYLNALWLQDPDRWGSLAGLELPEE